MSDGTIFVCEACRRELDPDDLNVVRRVKWDWVETFGSEGDQWVEGLGYFFHARHAPPLSSEWRSPSDG